MHFREYPLLNTPHLVIVLLKEAARGATSVEECATRLWAILETADEHPPVGVDEVLRRMDMLRRNLTEAQLVAPADGGRFAITQRGRDALKQHPAGFDTADLMVYPEFERFIRGISRPRRRMDPHTAGYDKGFAAYWEGEAPTDNPHPSDIADHLAWENGWFEALDEDVT